MWDRFFAINLRAADAADQGRGAAHAQSQWGRIVNNTTSYRTMHRVLPYGAVKAAFESMSAVWALQLEGSGITVNVLVPGGPTDTPFISDGAGWPRDKMLRPQIMGPPIRWLMSDATDSGDRPPLYRRRMGRRAAAGRGRAPKRPATSAGRNWPPSRRGGERDISASRVRVYAVSLGATSGGCHVDVNQISPEFRARSPMRCTSTGSSIWPRASRSSCSASSPSCCRRSRRWRSPSCWAGCS